MINFYDSLTSVEVKTFRFKKRTKEYSKHVFKLKRNLRASSCVCVHVIAVSGECYTLGSNQFGQLGHNNSLQSTDAGNRRSYHRVAQLDGHFVTKVACGDSFTVAVTKRMSLRHPLYLSFTLTCHMCDMPLSYSHCRFCIFT